ncbi:Yip1 family protein [Flavisphingomonas formosensis]|uniref:Yip1 family protein n=1 Tax=Flavisphingomonas formosensis TaxID=861534 RepID=UPI0012F8E8F5|nr:Yip1 family protein [Sphingomonas formosensis]
MDIVSRAKAMLMSPKTEWQVVASEPATVKELFTGYAAIMALLPVVGGLLKMLLIRTPFGMMGLPFGGYVAPLLLSYVIGLALIYAVILIADALAPSFDGAKNQIAAAKLIIYASTPVWIAGFFHFIPGLASLLTLLGFAYGAYLLYLGATVLMKVPEVKAGGYTVVIIVIWILLAMFIGGLIVGAVLGSLFFGGLVSPL